MVATDIAELQRAKVKEREKFLRHRFFMGGGGPRTRGECQKKRIVHVFENAISSIGIRVGKEKKTKFACWSLGDERTPKTKNTKH